MYLEVCTICLRVLVSVSNFLWGNEIEWGVLNFAKQYFQNGNHRMWPTLTCLNELPWWFIVTKLVMSHLCVCGITGRWRFWMIPNYFFTGFQAFGRRYFHARQKNCPCWKMVRQEKTIGCRQDSVLSYYQSYLWCHQGKKSCLFNKFQK